MAGLGSFDGITAVVTGASSGIGRLLALELARQGARVGLLARRERELRSLAGEIGAAGGRAEAIPCDVADPEQVSSAIRRTEEGLGPVDLLINNAGYGGHETFLQWNLEDIERMMRVNFLGSVYCAKAVLPGMVERGRGWLVFMASVAGRIAPPGESIYAASKFALVGLASALSLEVEDLGVEVLTVCPGAVRTPFFSEEDMEKLPAVARRRMVEPEALVRAVLDALRRGRRELTYPRWMALAYAVQGIAPGFTRKQVKRAVLGSQGGDVGGETKSEG